MIFCGFTKGSVPSISVWRIQIHLKGYNSNYSVTTVVNKANPQKTCSLQAPLSEHFLCFLHLVFSAAGISAYILSQSGFIICPFHHCFTSLLEVSVLLKFLNIYHSVAQPWGTSLVAQSIRNETRIRFHICGIPWTVNQAVDSIRKWDLFAWSVLREPLLPHVADCLLFQAHQLTCGIVSLSDSGLTVWFMEDILSSFFKVEPHLFLPSLLKSLLHMIS